jgi:hypothetical protein
MSRASGGTKLILCYCALEKLFKSQERIIQTQNTILERISNMGTVLGQVKQYAAQIDAASNAIAARIQKLVDQINAGTVAPEDVAAALQPEVDKLNALGADPSATPTA